MDQLSEGEHNPVPERMLSIQAERLSLLKRVLRVIVIIVVNVQVSSFIAAALLGFPYQLVAVILIGFILLAASIGCYKTLDKPQAQLLLIVFTIAMLAASIVFAVFFPNGEYLIFGGTITNIMLLALADYAQHIRWNAGLGVLVFTLVALLNFNGVLEPFYYTEQTWPAVIIPLISAAVIGVTAILLQLFNGLTQRSIAEAVQQRATADAAHAEITTTLHQVQTQAQSQARLLELVEDLETPVIPVLPGTLVLPVVGHLDTRRIALLTDHVLERVSELRAHTVLLDLTGVSLIDTATANYLLQLIRSVRLLGATCMLTGIRSEVAQTLVALGIDWSHIPTAGSLQEAIMELSIR